jgi:hypothetical protein
VRKAATALGAMVIAACSCWATIALAYNAPGRDALRTGAAALGALLGLVAIVGFVRVRSRRRAAVGFAIGYVALLLWWRTLVPSNDRDWPDDVARLAYATIDGDRVTFHDVRNFDYRSESDFTPAWYDRTYSLSALDQVDLVACYWMGPAIAHVLLSFGFGDEHLAISIEARRERGEGFSLVGGFFKQFELYYVVADERDAIRLRTNFRADPPEDVYLFRLRGDPARARQLFLEYVGDLNSLHERPRFYDALTENCTTTIRWNTRGLTDRMPWSWKLLLSGYAAEYARENERLDTDLPFDELRRCSRINDAARDAGDAPDFSRRIRAGLPPLAGR